MRGQPAEPPDSCVWFGDGIVSEQRGPQPNPRGGTRRGNCPRRRVVRFGKEEMEGRLHGEAGGTGRFCV